MTRTDAVVVEIIKKIDNLDLRTSEAEYTDTGEAWELFHDIRDRLNKSLPGYLQVEDL